MFIQVPSGNLSASPLLVPHASSTTQTVVVLVPTRATQQSPDPLRPHIPLPLAS